MEDLIEVVKRTGVVTENTLYYWGYQYRLGKEYIVPYLTRLGVFKKGDSIAEIGSAEGGVLMAFAQQGTNRLLATDIVPYRLHDGEQIAKASNLEIDFVKNDIINEPVPTEWKEKFDLVILRDVIEHIDDTKKCLKNISKLLKKGGSLYVTFPPYTSPFGGHQHTLQNIWGKIPYIHLLPTFIFRKLISSGRAPDINEVMRLRDIRLNHCKLTKAANECNFEVFHKDFFFLRPVYKMKFGLPALRLNAISFLPCVKNFFALEASYILKKN
ncbi:MAG TPA: class I SAM-dependent methyltransferase [Candidatus Kapabacteria bacterium]|nr:class I SAM-dependent methyltransferase [Candidatus Kapabacteria bacterium]HPO63406.1 class I SAM-dependent methyltransferase [Candidatus Kapabacteria bacterium]